MASPIPSGLVLRAQVSGAGKNTPQVAPEKSTWVDDAYVRGPVLTPPSLPPLPPPDPAPRPKAPAPTVLPETKKGPKFKLDLDWKWPGVDSEVPSQKAGEKAVTFGEYLKTLVLKKPPEKPEGRFEGSWQDYRKVLESHNQEVDQLEREQRLKDPHGRFLGVLGGPELQAPPKIPMAEAAEIWNARHLTSLGPLLTPPLGTIDPAIEKTRAYLQGLVEKLAGPALREKGITPHLNLFGGDPLNAFAGRTSDKWEGNDRIREEKARFNSAVASLEPVLGQPIYELGITLGSLKKVKSEGELAFLLAHELAHLLEGHVEPVGASWLSSQSHEAVADHQAFQMMVQAGYDPAEGLKLLERLHQGPAPVEMSTLLEGLSSGASSHHHEGVRLALGQLKVEQLRRTTPEAFPESKPQPLPEFLAELTARPVHPDPEGRLPKAIAARAEEYLQPGKVPLPAGLRGVPWESQAAGQAFDAALDRLEKSPLDGQGKGEAALLLLHDLCGLGWEAGQFPQSKDLGGFLARQLQAGFQAQPFLDRLASLSPNDRLEPKFATQVLLHPEFQKVAAPLLGSYPELDKLFDQAPAMLATPRSPIFADTPSLALKQFRIALTALGGAPAKADYGDIDWPQGVPAGQGCLDARHRANLLSYIKDHLAQPGKEEVRVLEQLTLSSEVQSPWVAQVEEALLPLRDSIRTQQKGWLSEAFRSPQATSQLLRSCEVQPLTPEQRKEAGQQLLETPYYSAPPVTGSSELGRIYADLLQDPKTSQTSKERAVSRLMQNLPVDGLGPGQDQSYRQALHQHLSQLAPKELALRCQREGLLGLGLPYTTSDSDSSKGPRSCTSPWMSTLGYDRKLGPKVAEEIPLTRLQPWYEGAKGNYLDSGTRLFMLDVLTAHSKPDLELKDWYGHLEGVLHGGGPFLEGRGAERQKLEAFLAPRLEKLQPAELRQWLSKKPVREVLGTDAQATLMAQLLCPEPISQPGQRVDSQQLRQDYESLEKELHLEKQPALRRRLQEKLAERARLQPQQVKDIFPAEERSLTQQAKGLDLQVRGLSALVAGSRTRSPQEQLQLLDYLMGRAPDPPTFASELEKLLEGASRTSGLTFHQALTEMRRSLSGADDEVRVAVATSFLAGPSGILRDEKGRSQVIGHFLEPVRDPHRPLATSLAKVLLDAHGSQDALAVGYLLAQRGTEGQKLSEGEVLNSLFDAYGVPGIKLKQYLAFTSDFEEFSGHFEASQDSAMPLNYLEAVKLIDHHYGDSWPSHWEVRDVIGSGSVNVAVRFYDQQSKETKVVSLPRQKVEVASEYDFWRLGKFLDLFTAEPANQEKYGFLRGLTHVIRDSVSLEFDRESAFQMQQSVQPFYQRQVDGWTIKTVQAYDRQGKAIVMEEAKGQTARRVLHSNPEVYRSAMGAMATVEQDALLGIQSPNDPTSRALHANPDFHDGQVLIDEESKTVTILDFGQAVPIDRPGREYAVDVLSVVGKAYKPEDAARLLQERTGVRVDLEDLKKVLASPKDMDVFTRLLGTVAGQGGKIPIPVVHWILGMNRQRALGEKIDRPFEKQIRNLGKVRFTGGSLDVYNAMRIARRTPIQALQGGLLGPVGGWLQKVLREQSWLDLARGRAVPQTLAQVNV